ncbi:RluA family pseudouridine synthase [Aestuariicella hydrocarbonica]|uniref:RluA family pseudouridine synthase n=1 Tax=Pseudomaricurvus hydrocarbonicus TaxID=1470433 RepID=A0A9E5T242_9GAMM|nr:RluA family pseudouridine synthase [Aestuariicella hydrocarbonica]NHO67441.1 RluA family pseudouridine synthase [Aestuariicella hydrocarbonica]
MSTATHNSGDDFIAPPCDEQIDVVYEDAQLLVINKPSGLLSLSGKNPANKDSVHHRMVQSHPTALMVHRLDFGTSGLLLLALNKSVNAQLCAQFQARTVTKTYIALLQGHLHEPAGVIDYPIAKDKSHFPYQKICSLSGKPAQSRYQLLQHEGKNSRVAFEPMTGRTHQLRIHSREFGHPILGCDLYHAHGSQHQAARLLLHASELAFDHPLTGQRLHLRSPCPF